MQKLGPRVRAVEPLQQYYVRVTFENGVVREIHLAPYLLRKTIYRNNAI